MDSDRDSDRDRPGGLLAWQWTHYADGHRDRRNLVVHAVTMPLFALGTCACVAAPFVAWWAAAAGVAAIAVAAAAQGRGHAVEASRPLPFRGPADVVARLFVEQWVTFPRFVVSGGFARAWRATAAAG